MKRDRSGAPTMIVHRWNRPPLSCRPCREKKRRCDRKQPCANCSLRNLQCDYTDNTSEGHSTVEGESHPPAFTTRTDQPDTLPPHVSASAPNLPAPTSGEILARIRRLEDAVFNDCDQENPFTIGRSNQRERRERDFRSFKDMSQKIDLPTELSAEVANEFLPPLPEASILFDHFAKSLHPTSSFLHIPSTYELLQESYKSLQNGLQVDLECILLLLSIFSGAALAWTRPMLMKLSTTKSECKIAFSNYSKLAMTILENTKKPLPPSTTALAGIATLAAVFINGDGFSHKVSTARSRCLLMARVMQLHRLDTARAREERQRNGCNMIEVEVQRRIWWHMVADDWLISFAGGPFDGVYTFNPHHMNVDYPKNVDDEYITASMPGPDMPLSTPTSMSGFLARIRFATICREIVDTISSTLLDDIEPDYGVVLGLGQKLQDHLDQLPTFLKLDPESVAMSRPICAQRPYIALQRLTMNFTIHTRICRLHRLYHLEGSLNPEYAYSRTMCIRSAHRILELRRAMDQVGTEVGCHPARFWKITQHVFLAALTLATDVSINPEEPDVEDRKTKVMAAYRTLERSREDSMVLVGTIQRNLQAIMTAMESRRAVNTVPVPGTLSEQETGGAIGNEFLSEHPPYPKSVGLEEVGAEPALDFMSNEIPISVDGSASVMESSGMDQLWSDFWSVAPELEATDWNMLLEDMYTDWTPNIQ